MADKPIPSGNIFRVVDGKYVHNNEEISKEEFYKRKAEADSAMREMRGLPSSSVRGKEPSFDERKAKAFADLEGMKKGGEIMSGKKDKYPKTMTDAAKRVGRDTVRSMGLDPDVDYGEVAKKKMSDAAIDAGVVVRDVGRLYGRGYGMDVSPTEGEKGMKKLREERDEMSRETRGMKKGGKVKSASSRADGIAQRGKTRGMMK